MLINIDKTNKNELNVQNNLTTLIGMMGSGKSKFGNLVAKKLNLKFYDTDILIERKFNLPIKDLFKIHGETFFRRVEKKEIYNIVNKARISKENSVISIGGGAFDNLSTRKLLLEYTNVIWLNAPLNSLIDRVGDGFKRPMIQGDVKTSLNNILKKRIKYYILCHYKLDTDKISQKEITKQIIRIVLQ